MTSVFRFTKGQGTGNDFILYTDPEGVHPLSRKDIVFLCDRRRGVGADGVIRAVKSAHLPEGEAILEEDETAEWFMDYYNADGSQAEMCGNGIRVFVAYLLRNALVTMPDGSALAVGTRAGIRDVQRSGSGFQVDLGRWCHEGSDYVVRTEKLPGTRSGCGVSLGNPHVVVEVSDDSELDGLDLSGPPVVKGVSVGGVNVEYVARQDPVIRDGVGQIRMRVFERGSGETLSCGTGAAAAALAIRDSLGAGAPHHWKIAVPGGVVGVRMFPAEDGEHVGLSGPAELVFRGEILLPAGD